LNAVIFFATGTAYRDVMLEIGGFPESEKTAGLKTMRLFLNLISRGKRGAALMARHFITGGIKPI
jgi:hypothetical protein